MGLTAAETGGDFEQTPEGVYTARCYRIIDLGTQTSTWNNQDKQSHKVMISWELIGKEDPRMQDGENKGKPFSVHQRYTVSLGENARLRKDLDSWRGKKFTAEELKGFDLSKVLGQFCTVQIVHDETGKYSNVDTIMAFRGEKPDAENTDLVFDIDNPDMQIFDTLSDSLKKTIEKAPEWKGGKAEPTPDSQKKDVVIDDISGEEINLDDIPF